MGLIGASSSVFSVAGGVDKGVMARSWSVRVCEAEVLEELEELGEFGATIPVSTLDGPAACIANWIAAGEVVASVSSRTYLPQP